MMGFKADMFVRSVDEYLFCSICHEVFEDPVNCKDGHTFCKVCITTWLNKNKKCPLDNGVLEEKQLVRVLTVRGVIGNLEVYCHLQDAVKGNIEGFAGKCDWIGQLQYLTQHRETCPFQEVQCPHGCSENIQREKMKDHEKICDQKLVDCEECGLDLVRKDLEKHKANECLQALVSCPNECKNTGKELIKSIKRMDLADHLSKSCPKTLVNCPYKEQGCVVKVVRRDVEKHVQKNMAAHMMLLAKQCSLLRNQNMSLTQQCTYLKNELKKIRREVKPIENELQSSTYTWTINDFRDQKKKHHLHYFRSPTFWLCGYSWYLKIFPDGYTKNTEGSLSLYLNASCNSNCGGESCVIVPNGKISVCFRLTLKSQDPQYEDVSREATFDFRYNQTESFGWPMFVNSVKVHSPAYYDSKKDSITFQCTIQPDSKTDKPQ